MWLSLNDGKKKRLWVNVKVVDFGSYGKKKCDNSCGPKIIHKSIVNRVFLLVEFM